jgi:hypothetical protein
MGTSNMSRACLALLMVSGLLAQTPGNVFEKVPPDVDAALRDRITAFFQAHVDKKSRQAEQYVADDSKDFFFEAAKPVYMEFRIDKITYSANFTKATALVVCKMPVVLGFINQIATVPIPSNWKLENGQWYWYVDPKAGRDTPFGHWTPSGETSTGVLPPLERPSVESLQQNVQADKRAVQLNSRQPSSDQVMIASKMPGPVTLRLAGVAPPGLKVNLDRTELKPGEQAKVTFTFTPREGSKAGKTEVSVLVQPLNLVIGIDVTIQ